MADDALLMLCHQIRRDTLRILSAVDDDCLLFAPEGTSNHVLWHCGHAVWLQDVLCLQLLGHESRLPVDWVSNYGMNCEPVAARTNWRAPSRSTIWTMIRVRCGVSKQIAR